MAINDVESRDIDDEATAEMDLPTRLLSEVLELRGVVEDTRMVITNLHTNYELVRNEQVRQGKVLAELLNICKERGKLCHVIGALSVNKIIGNGNGENVL